MSYVFFPGCSLEGTARDFGVSTEAVVRALGLELPELENWICCGSTPAHQSDPLLATALPAKNLLAAHGKTVAVACAACYNRLKAANHDIAADPATRKKVAEVVGADYDGQTPVKHLLEILVGDLGTARIAQDVVRPLAGLKVVCYYGCLLARPPEVTHFDNAENPTLMDQVMAAAGATVIDWPHKTECCGGSYSITDVDIVLMLTREVLSMARLAGADCIVTACPLCQINLDMRQKDVADKYGDSFNMPVFYFTQLLGLALGLTPKALRLSSLVVDPTALLASRGIVPGSGAQPAPALSGKAHT